MVHATVPCFMQSVLDPTVSCFMQSVLDPTVPCFMQPMLAPTGAGSLEGTWVRGGCRVAPAGHAGRDGRLPGNTSLTHSLLHVRTHCFIYALIPHSVWTTMLTFALCLSECAVTAIADGAGFKCDVTCQHDSFQSGQWCSHLHCACQNAQ